MPPVFDTILTAVNNDTALEAAYNALRVLRHRQHTAQYARTLRARPSNEVDETTARLIEAIEKREQRPIEQMDDRRAERYIVDLAELMLERTTKDTAHLRAKALAELKALREELDA
jgi:hypothetical protein